MSLIRNWLRREAPNGDWYDAGFTIIVFALAIGGIHFLNGSAAIALVTAVTASVAIYRLRKPDNMKIPAVRQAFEVDEDRDRMDFGFRNYGPGPALYLQIEARLADSNDVLFEFEPREHPLHLPEGEFVGFVHDDRPNDGLLNAINEAIEDGEQLDETVHFYFSYVSSSQVRVPEDMSYEPSQDDEEMFEELRNHSQKPRRMKLGEIQQYCLPKASEYTEVEALQ